MGPNKTYELLKSKGNHIRQPLDLKKIFANNETNMSLISKVYKQVIKLKIRKTNNQVKKCGKDLKRHFPKKRYTDG